jgi:hypothetical protein
MTHCLSKALGNIPSLFPHVPWEGILKSSKFFASVVRPADVNEHERLSNIITLKQRNRTFIAVLHLTYTGMMFCDKNIYTWRYCVI